MSCNWCRAACVVNDHVWHVVCLLHMPPSSTQRTLLSHLDKVCQRGPLQVASRAFFLQAELLWRLAGWGGGGGVSRQGPALGRRWVRALNELACSASCTEAEANVRAAAVQKLAEKRDATVRAGCHSARSCLSGCSVMTRPVASLGC